MRKPLKFTVCYWPTGNAFLLDARLQNLSTAVFHCKSSARLRSEKTRERIERSHGKRLAFCLCYCCKLFLGRLLNNGFFQTGNWYLPWNNKKLNLFAWFSGKTNLCGAIQEVFIHYIWIFRNVRPSNYQGYNEFKIATTNLTDKSKLVPILTHISPLPYEFLSLLYHSR